MRTVKAAVLCLAIAAVFVSCSSGPAPPKPGTNEWYWNAAVEQFTRGDLAKSQEHLEKLMATDNPYKKRAATWHLVVLAVLNTEAWQHFAQEIGIRADMPETLTDSRVEAKILRRVARNLRGFPGYAKVNRVLLLREPWSVENGLLTPTLKIKRTEIAQQFAAQIKQLYERR